MSATRRRLFAATAILAAIALAFLAGLFVAGRSTGLAGRGGAGVPGAARYQCPMHPTYLSDRPGDCPICGMRLVPIDPAQPHHAGAAAGATAGATTDPTASGSPPVSDRATVHLPARKQEMIGVKTGVAQRASLRRTVRAPAVVTADETRLHHVHTKVEGWVETLHVNATGTFVHRGEPLLDLYSPELLATQEEHLVALRARRAGAAAPPDSAAMAADLVDSSRRRLLLFDMTPAQIDALEASGRPQRVVTLHAPIAGFVTQRMVTQGERVEPGSTLFDIADLSRVWVIASVFENEMPFVRPGQKGIVSLAYLPGRTWEGRVTQVAPVVDEQTRTVKVRLEFPNPDGTLKPGMFGEAALEADLGERLQVPDGAVLSSGTRDLVFVVRPDGGFEARAVRLGARTDDAVEILDGLRAGETIVISGGFLVDAESRLKAALEAATAPAPAPDKTPKDRP